MKFRKLGQIFKEPIVQFTLLGALIFGMDRALVVNRDDPNNILIDDDQIQQLVEIFQEGQGREPSGREINNMVIVWAQNEILYREARKMGLDRGDDMIRNRLILKIRNVLFNNVVITDPSDAQLQEFFEFNKAAYFIPERYDIELIALPDSYDRAAAQAVLSRALNEDMPDSYLSNRYEYKSRQHDHLVQMLGEQASQTLLSESNSKSWTLISLNQRHHLVRVTARHDAVEPPLASVRDRVAQDYERYIGDTQISDQTYHIARQYRVHLEVSDRYLEKMENQLPRNVFEEAQSVGGNRDTLKNMRSEVVLDER